ncbi:MAG: SMP-30/gluconolactonase/LRE family protein, partial [Planctomycetaceae bacterium]
MTSRRLLLACVVASLSSSLLALSPRIARAQDMALSGVLIENEGWQLVSQGHKFTEGPTADAAGNVYFSDIPESRIHRISPAGEVTLFASDTGKTNGLKVGPDGRLYGCRGGDRQIVA